jgi:OOP family OmpA-OmpF porin
MASTSDRLAPRFHRRILGLGALGTVLLLVIGAPFFVNRVEDDLEQRVPSELAEAGFVGITATFTGQDGTLRCAAPLDDPEQALAAAYDVWGVRAIEIDRSCRVNRAPVVETTTTVASDDDGGLLDGTSPTDSGDPGGADPTTGTAPTTSIPPDFDNVAELVGTSPQLSLLAVLIQEAGLVDILGPDAEQAVTLFAPADEAFDALAADAFAKLRADPEMLRQVLSHHAAVGILTTGDLVDGTLGMLDGGSVEIAADDSNSTVSGATIVTPDIAAVNGIVHIIDQVLIPEDVDLSTPSSIAATTVEFENAAVTMTGVVASEVERAVLTAAISGAPGPLEVDDQLTVDPDSGLDAATTSALAQLVAAMPINLLNGVSGFDGIGLYLTGTYLTEADRQSMTAVAESVGATVDLRPPPEATDTDATDLEAELNAYVLANPVLFEPSSSILTDSSLVVLDRLALLAQQFAGVAITVEGHTDSDGDPDENRALSQFRALVVRQALIDRGILAASITAVGVGSEQPVLVAGVEDKAASRRVEFRVVATS